MPRLTMWIRDLSDRWNGMEELGRQQASYTGGFIRWSCCGCIYLSAPRNVPAESSEKLVHGNNPVYVCFAAVQFDSFVSWSKAALFAQSLMHYSSFNAISLPRVFYQITSYYFYSNKEDVCSTVGPPMLNSVVNDGCHASTRLRSTSSQKINKLRSTGHIVAATQRAYL